MGEVSKREAVIKNLNRMAADGFIEKLSKGKYYKPESTPFGELPPDQREVVKDLLEKNDKRIGYITGIGVYNKLGLTTQISNTIQVGRNETRPKTKRGKFSIKFVKQKNTITKETIPLLQILDAIKYIKKIPDTTVDKACGRLIEILVTVYPQKSYILNLKFPINYFVINFFTFESFKWSLKMLDN